MNRAEQLKHLAPDKVEPGSIDEGLRIERFRAVSGYLQRSFRRHERWAHFIDFVDGRPDRGRIRLRNPDHPGADISLDHVGNAWDLFCDFGEDQPAAGEHGVTVARLRVMVGDRTHPDPKLTGTIGYGAVEGREAEVEDYLGGELNGAGRINLPIRSGDLEVAQSVLALVDGSKVRRRGRG